MSYLSWGGSAVVGHPERVAFDAENSNVELRADSRRGSVDDIYDYSTFYAWLSRFGMHPHFTHEAYEDSSVPAILVNPKATLGKRAKERIVTYLRDGGRLLLLFDSGVTAPHELNSFLNEFDIVLVPVQKGFGVFDANGPDFQNSPLSLAFDVLTTTHAARGAKRLDTQTVSFGLSGVTPLVVDDNGVIIAGERRVGKGRITVFSRSMIFSEFVFGDVWGGKELEDDKRRLYNFGRELAEHACKFEE